MDSIFAEVKPAILAPQWRSFRTKEQFFEPYLVEVKGTNSAKLRADWWLENRRTKWGAWDQECTNLVFQQYIEEKGNTIPKRGSIGGKEPVEMEGLILKVFWPADNLTRACKLLKYDKKGQFWNALYYFDEQEYREYLDTDWAIFPLNVTCPYCEKKVGPRSICPECKSRMTL